VKNGFPFHAITARSTIDGVASEESDHGRQKLERRDEDDEDQADVVNLAQPDRADPLAGEHEHAEPEREEPERQRTPDRAQHDPRLELSVHDARIPAAPGLNPLRVCRAGRELGDLETDLVDVAPEPVLARLERLDDRMRDRPRVLRRVLVRRRVAAADVAARHAAPQVQPVAAHGEALLAALGAGRRIEDLVEVGTGHRHTKNGTGHVQSQA